MRISSVVPSEGRTGAGIRQFLHYYALVILNKGPASAPEVVDTIQTDSADNRTYRPNGALRVAQREVEEVLRGLAARKQVARYKSAGTFRITNKGRTALAKAEKARQQPPKSKDAAVENVLSILGPGAADKYVLDVGTGEGYLAFKLAQAGFKVLGIDSGEFDYSKDSIQKARGKAEQTSNVEFRVADVRNLRGLNGAFDFVVASQAVHCMKAQRTCMKAIYRLLKPGGQFVASDFAIGRLGFFAHGFHVFLAITREEWFEILSKCGFLDVAIHDIDDYCVVHARRRT
jgi:2-polyprenyl-3-methyl-5-hydroxy-6-metoxy-1,4-benzoquinol methylase